MKTWKHDDLQSVSDFFASAPAWVAPKAGSLPIQEYYVGASYIGMMENTLEAPIMGYIGVVLGLY